MPHNTTTKYSDENGLLDITPFREGPCVVCGGKHHPSTEPACAREQLNKIRLEVRELQAKVAFLEAKIASPE